MEPKLSGKDKGMKMTKLAAAAAAMGLALAVWGCSGAGSLVEVTPQENCAIIKKDGSVQWASVEAYDQGSYTQDEMLAFAKERVSAYNASLGKEAASENKEGAEALPVAVVSGKLEEGTALLVTAYDTPARLIEFAREIGDGNVTFTDLATGTVGSMGEKLAAVSWKDAKGNGAAAADVTKNADAIVITAEGQGIIRTEKKVLYVSQDCTLQSENTVQTAAEGPSYIIME